MNRNPLLALARVLALTALSGALAAGALAQPLDALYAQARKSADAGERHAALATLETLRRSAPEHREAALLQLYLLTDTQQFERASQQAVALTKRRPHDAGAWLAAAYVWRHGADFARALGAYQRAGALEPGNRDALLGQVLVLRATSAPERALALAQSTAALVDAPLLDGLRQDVAAQLIRSARDTPGTPAERAERLARAERLLADIASPDAGVRADQLVLESVRGAHATVLARYEAQFEPASAPARATQAAAEAAAALRQPTRALALYETLLRADPRDTSAQRGRFYALADLGRYEEAQACADGLADYLARSGEVTGARSAQVLRAYARAWARQYETARRILERALERTPQDNELRAALGRVLAWGERPQAARAELERVLADDPQHLEARVALVGLAQQAESPALAQPGIDALAQELGEAHDALQALAREQRALLAPWVWAQWRTSLEHGADAHFAQLEAGSVPFGAHSLRVLAGLAQQRYSGPAGALAETRTSVGLQAGSQASGLRARVHRLSRDARTGGELVWSGALAPAWRLRVRASLNDDEVAAAARLAGVSAKRAGVELAWRPQSHWRAWGSLERSWLSDGNTGAAVSAGAARRFELAGARQWELAGSAGLSQAGLDTGPYFSPRRARWAEAQLRALGTLRLADGAHALNWQAGPLIGAFGQTGFASRAYAGAEAALAWEPTPTLSFTLKANAVRRPYDGHYVRQHGLTLGVFGRLP